MSTWAILAVIVLATSSVKGEYGDKVRTNETSSSLSAENISSSEEYYDDSAEEKQTTTPEKPLTTPDDGVVIEKAILAAEIIPKASYNLVDYPIRYDDSLGDSYTQARFGDKNEFFGYASSDTSSSQEEVNTLISSSHSENKNSPGRDSENSGDKSDTESMQKSSQTHNGYQFPTWNFLDMYKVPSIMPLKPFSSTYINPINVDIETTKASEIKNNGLGLSEDGTYNPVANGDFLHLGYQSSPQQSESSFSEAFSPELLAHLEQERQYQIESTKIYLKQVEAAQEYAAKVQALHESLYPSYQSSPINFQSWSGSRMHENHDSFISPITPQTPKQKTQKPKTVSKTDSPGVNDFALKNTHSRPTLFSPEFQPTAAQVNPLSGGGWMFSATSPSSGFVPCTGPTASPVVLPSGFLADTEEVMQARIAHLQAMMNAMKISSAWKSRQSQRWS